MQLASSDEAAPTEINVIGQTVDEATHVVEKFVDRAFLAGKLVRSAPTAAEEEKDQTAADAFYEQAGTWLRENTRDTKKFSILFGENVTYGYRRNLLGLKWIALGLNLAVAVVCGALLWHNAPIDTADPFTGRVIVVLDTRLKLFPA